ncbi:MAG: beta-ketoacyl synthase chain length factor [Bacteroidales bacterium]|nr:beta-ketoacyl synthase chain length factor [Bacteroidales bacterium]
MKAYIKGAAILSPQKTFGEKGFPGEVTDYHGVSYLKCIEPAYRDFIDPMVARRMSRIVKMGVCSALKCMQDSGISMPDAILAGTGLGCLEDTEKFLGSVYTHEEKLLNPTPFIQSTHNTIAGAVALAIKCHNYNATYTHRGFSFESALEDAFLHLEENPELNLLAGAFDELTTNSYNITRRMGLWKNHPVNSADLLNYQTRGSLPGEGVAFFMLGGRKGSDMAVLRSVKTFYKPHGYPEIESIVDQFLRNEGLTPGDIDLVIAGINGDFATDRVYYQLKEGVLGNRPFAWYKHLCGEYDTSSSFALWLASVILKDQHVPDCALLEDIAPVGIERILIYNHLRENNHVLYLTERC